MFQEVKMGRVPTDPLIYRQQPQIHRYLAEVPKHLVADAVSYRGAIVNPLGALGNTKYGCCTCAAIGHIWQVVCANLGVPCPVTEKMVLGWYKAVNPTWDPNDESTDTGATMLSVLQYLVRQGVIVAYATVNFTDAAKFMAANEFFCGTYCGFALPVGWQTTNVWGPNAGHAGGWGGHAVNTASCDEDANADVITWGDWVQVTRGGVLEYCDECYVVIFNEWMARGGKSLQYLGLTALKAEMRALV